MTRSQVDATPLAVTYAAPLLDISGYATMARAVVLGLDALGVQVTAQPLWRAGVPEIRSLEAVPAGMSLRTLDCGGELVQVGFRPGPQGEAQRIVLRLGDGTLYEYRTAVDAADVQRILALASTGRRVGGPFVLHMLPAHHGRDIYASARALNPGHPYYVGSTMFETDGIPAGWELRRTRSRTCGATTSRTCSTSGSRAPRSRSCGTFAPSGSPSSSRRSTTSSRSSPGQRARSPRSSAARPRPTTSRAISRPRPTAASSSTTCDASTGTRACPGTSRRCATW